MNTPTCIFAPLSAVLLSSSVALSAPIDLTIDPALSSLDMSITVDVGVASDTDTDTSTLSGNIEIELDNANNPTQITLNDIVVVIDETMVYNWSFGFLGSANATMTGGSVSGAAPGLPTWPVPVELGSFSFPSVLVFMNGLLDVNYDILLVGTGSELIDMSQQGWFETSFSGDIVIVDDTITVTSTLPLDSTQPLLDPNGTQIGTVTTFGTATIVAVGTVPPCLADINGDGMLNFFDVSAFLAAFTAMDPAGDFNGDGVYNFFDVSAFLNAFTAGCP